MGGGVAGQVLGFDVAADGDEVFQGLVLAQIIEPTSSGAAHRLLHLVRHLRSRAQLEGPLGELSKRELEVLALVAEGLSNQRIAEELVISEHTVKRHVANILRRLGLSSRTAAASLAARHGLRRSSKTRQPDRAIGHPGAE